MTASEVAPARRTAGSDAEAAAAGLEVRVELADAARHLAERRVVREAQAAARAARAGRSRPRPPRIAVLPLPKRSQAKPRRGAIASYLLVLQRAVRSLGAALEPAAEQGLVPGTIARPLQGSPPSAGLKSAGSKLVIVSSSA